MRFEDYIPFRKYYYQYGTFDRGIIKDNILYIGFSENYKREIILYGLDLNSGSTELIEQVHEQHKHRFLKVERCTLHFDYFRNVLFNFSQYNEIENKAIGYYVNYNKHYSVNKLFAGNRTILKSIADNGEVIICDGYRRVENRLNHDTALNIISYNNNIQLCVLTTLGCILINNMNSFKLIKDDKFIKIDPQDLPKDVLATILLNIRFGIECNKITIKFIDGSKDFVLANNRTVQTYLKLISENLKDFESISCEIGHKTFKISKK